VSLDSTNPEISLAESILDSVSREVQGEGWHFNTEINYPFTPDVNGHITVPSNVLQLSDNKTSNLQKYQTVLRDGKLYDKVYHTYVFDDSEPVLCDVVWFIDFEDLYKKDGFMDCDGKLDMGLLIQKIRLAILYMGWKKRVTLQELLVTLLLLMSI
jgi:hypothetical protein